MEKERKPTKVWDNCIKIGETMKYDRRKLVVELVARDGVKMLNIREWYKAKRDETWKPAWHGILIPFAVPVDGVIHKPMKDVMRFVNEAIGMLATFSIDDPENAVYAVKKIKEARQ